VAVRLVVNLHLYRRGRKVPVVSVPDVRNRPLSSGCRSFLGQEECLVKPVNFRTLKSLIVGRQSLSRLPDDARPDEGRGALEVLEDD